MSDLRTMPAEQTDPVTGNSVSREALLGLNAKRIGEILTSMGKTQEALNTYKESLAYYQQALAKVPRDGDEYKALQKAMDEIPAAK